MTTTDRDDLDDATLGILARDVARHLGPNWTLDTSALGERHRPLALNRPDGARLLIGFDDWTRARRVEIWGTYPDRIRITHRLPRHEITVSRARGAQVIAREIVRRLLPAYQPDLCRAREIVLRRAQQKQDRDRLAEQITEALPRTQLIEDEARGTLSCDLREALPGRAWGSIDLDRDGQAATVDLHQIPAYVVVRVVAALKEAADEQDDSPETRR